MRSSYILTDAEERLNVSFCGIVKTQTINRARTRTEMFKDLHKQLIGAGGVGDNLREASAKFGDALVLHPDSTLHKCSRILYYDTQVT